MDKEITNKKGYIKFLKNELDALHTDLKNLDISQHFSYRDYHLIDKYMTSLSKYFIALHQPKCDKPPQYKALKKKGSIFTTLKIIVKRNYMMTPNFDFSQIIDNKKIRQIMFEEIINLPDAYKEDFPAVESEADINEELIKIMTDKRDVLDRALFSPVLFKCIEVYPEGFKNFDLSGYYDIELRNVVPFLKFMREYLIPKKLITMENYSMIAGFCGNQKSIEHILNLMFKLVKNSNVPKIKKLLKSHILYEIDLPGNGLHEVNFMNVAGKGFLNLIGESSYYDILVRNKMVEQIKVFSRIDYYDFLKVVTHKNEYHILDKYPTLFIKTKKDTPDFVAGKDIITNYIKSLRYPDIEFIDILIDIHHKLL